MTTTIPDGGTVAEPLGPPRPPRCLRCTNTLDLCDCIPIPEEPQ